MSSRIKDFKVIKDKILANLDLWKSKHLSLAGKTTLINSVLVAKASYYMQGLLFPKSVCCALDKAIRDFFWGDCDNSRKMHLLGWDKICRTKDRGGLGIPLFQARNVAFFSKLFWFALQQPTKPWAVICNHRYSLKSCSSSMLGKGLVCGAEIVKKGSFISLNSGASTLFWEDSWCFLGPLRHIIHGPLLPHEMSLKVVDVVVGPRVWDWDLISFDLPPNIRNSISATPINIHANSPDSRVWSANLNGHFDISSAYSIAAQISSSCDSINDRNFGWVWKSKCHIRRKLFVWKVAHCALPLNAVLAKRGLNINSLCPLCGQEEESFSHIFKLCPMTLLIWEAAGLRLSLIHHDDFFTWVRLNATSSVTSSSRVAHGTLFIYLLWNIWCTRNQKVFQSATFIASSAVSCAYSQATEWTFLAGSSSNKKPSFEVLVSWKPPQVGWFKLNSDGSCQGNVHGYGEIAAAGVVRDCHGKWLKGFVCYLGCGNSLLAELWSIYLGIVLAREQNFDPIYVESDCSTAVFLLNDEAAGFSHHYAAIINLCRLKLAQFSDFKVVHVVREGNQVADKLAGFARNSRTDFSVFDVMPPFVSALALADCMGIGYPRLVGPMICILNLCFNVIVPFHEKKKYIIYYIYSYINHGLLYSL